MPIPTPEPGLVISYSYLWHREGQAGLEEARKSRPSVIIVAATRQQDEKIIVTVLPITHLPPEHADLAVEIPDSVKRHLGLDDQRSWVLVTEGNKFFGRAMIWP